MKRRLKPLPDEGSTVLDEEFADRARPEITVAQVRRHGRRLTLPVLALFAIAIASGVWIGSFPEPWMNLVALGVAGLLLIVCVLLPVVFWLTERATITTRRIILRRGVFSRHRAEFSLSRVREVHSRRSLVQRMFGSGDVELRIGSESSVIPDVPGVLGLTDALSALIERNYQESLRFGPRPGVGESGSAARITDTDFWA